MRANYPVGLDKASNQFGFYHWQHHDDTLWQQMVSDATEQFHHNLERMQARPLTVVALDADSHAIYATHKNLTASGLMPLVPSIVLEQRNISQLANILAKLTVKNPLIISNPPYGERLGELDAIKSLYQGLGRQVADGLRQASIDDGYLAILASQIEHADVLPISEPKTLRCHNGALTVYFRHGKPNTDALPALIERFEKQEIVHDDAQEFVNRLQKNLANLKKQAKKDGITNLRIYDADLPNYNVAVDLYGDYVHVQEYAPPKTIDPAVAKHRFNNALAVVRQVLNVDREAVFIKTRAKQSGNDQYTKNETNKRKKLWLACEHQAYFYVNFTDYLDTGLFIDHRNMRQLVKAASRGKRVLNLFAYTCTASVHAALNGAKSVTSVDLSANYLDWGRQNFALNGLVLDALHDDQPKYQFIAADVFEWIKDNTEQFDVIFIDPPTFSNSKKFKGTFDVQRDHVALINRAMNRLTTGGVLYFSNNFTKFELDESLKQRYQVQEITHKTIGFDFDAKKPIHQSYEIRHKNANLRPQFDDEQSDRQAQSDTHKAGAFKKSDQSVKSNRDFAGKSNRAFDGKSDKNFDKKSDKKFDKKSPYNDRKTGDWADNKQGKFDKTTKPQHGKPSNRKADFAPKQGDKKTAKRFEQDKFANKSNAAKNNAKTKPEHQLAAGTGKKRVFINPKLANKDEIAQRLKQALDNLE